MAFAGLFIACGSGGAGNVEGVDDPAGPFSGMGSPGASVPHGAGIFSGSGWPGVGGASDMSNRFAVFCDRVHAICPDTSVSDCVAFFQSQWDKSATDCWHGLYYSFLNCVESAGVTCGANGQANVTSALCIAPSLSQCGSTTGTTGGGTGGGETGGTGGAGTGGTGTGGSGGNTGGSGGNTGGTGGNTGGSGGTGGTGGGTGGTGGRGGGGPRDGGRG